MKSILERLERMDWVFEVKPLFDHIRNYGIAGAIAGGSFLFYEKFPFNESFLYVLFFLAAVLALLNALSGVTYIFQWLRNKNYPLSTRFLASLAYCLATFVICATLLEAAVQK